MFRKLLIVAMLTPFLPQLWGQEVPCQQYYIPYESGIARYKIEAVRALASPEMRAEASRWSIDPRVQELIVSAKALDSLVYDGFRLVRTRGVLTTLEAIDQSAVYRTVMYFNVAPHEAYAWLLASRLMQMSQFKNDGVALATIERELMDTALDIQMRLKTYFNTNDVVRLMPRFFEGEGYPRSLVGPAILENPRAVRAAKAGNPIASKNGSCVTTGLMWPVMGRANETNKSTRQNPESLVTTVISWPVMGR